MSGGRRGRTRGRPGSSSVGRGNRFDSGRVALGQNGKTFTSPPARVPAAAHVLLSIEFLAKWTEPSPNRTLAPPGCQLRAAFQPCDSKLLSWLGFSTVGRRRRGRGERDAHGDDPSPGAASNQVRCHRSAWISRAGREAATTRCDGDDSECGPHPVCLGDEGTRGQRFPPRIGNAARPADYDSYVAETCSNWNRVWNSEYKIKGASRDSYLQLVTALRAERHFGLCTGYVLNPPLLPAPTLPAMRPCVY
jgi:hypothetical protein